MNVHFPARRSRWPGRLLQLAVIVIVAAVAAATFMLSYAGVHAIALQAGVPRELARYYPGILDAVLVIACAAAPVLRDAPWWARCYAWLAILVVVVVIGGVDAVHAMNVALPHRATAGVAAALPWALLLLAFSLWLTILRHLRAQYLAAASEGTDAPEAAASAPGGTVARKALEAAAPSAASVADEDGAGKVAGEVTEGPAKAPPTTAEAGQPAGAHRSEPEPEHGLSQGREEGEPAAETAPRADAPPDKRPPGSDAPGSDAPGLDALPGMDAAPDADAGAVTGYEPGSADEAPEAVTEVPAITYATGPRLRRVRSLPAPPVDEDE